jgi:hypothetical protein
MQKRTPALVAIEAIASRILMLRGERVVVDSDLARLYGVTTRRLNEQVKRNRQRFADGFVFRLRAPEAATLNRDPRFAPYAFTEHGRHGDQLCTPTEVSVYVVRAFVALPETLASQNQAITGILSVIRHLMASPQP